ncbi:MAG: DUF359 domain-containing protein [Promethearchaeota archaeon]
MAGTLALNLFDRLHKGHRLMIDRLSEMPKPVACVTDGELISQGLDLFALIQPAEHRLRMLDEYIQSIDLDDVIRTSVARTNDDLMSIEGNTTFLMYEGPCCKEIQDGALAVRKRKLGVEDHVELLKPIHANDGDKLSSGRIRLGEIDREGKRLRGTKEPPRILELGDRDRLKAPKGHLYNIRDGKPETQVVQRIRNESPIKVISVGDVTSYTLQQEGYTPDVMIVDGITKRGLYPERFSGTQEFKIYNPAATIYPEAWSVVDTAIHEEGKSLILVDGEEDLMGFPAVLLAPVGSAVVYGQPNAGIVWIPVNDENKRIAEALLEEMPIIEE